MGNHSETGELLEEARAVALTDKNAYSNTLTDEFGNVVKLDRSPEELTNPTKLKDSSDRDVVLIRNGVEDDGNKLTLKQAKALEEKLKKKKAP